MSRYTGPRYRIVRRLGTLPGFYSAKDNGGTKTPGQHGKGKPKPFQRQRVSAYGLRLMEKQKLRFNYHITERQLFNYVKRARRISGPTGKNLLTLLEMRLDNIVFRMGMAKTIVAARQFISHGHITVNNKKMSCPSYQCQVMESVGVKKDSKSRKLIEHSINTRLKQSAEPKAMSKYKSGSKTHYRYSIPKYLGVNRRNLSGVIRQPVVRKQVRLRVNERLVVEYYSRR